MGNLPEVLQGAQVSSIENDTGHPYHALWCRNEGSSQIRRIYVKKKKSLPFPNGDHKLYTGVFSTGEDIQECLKSDANYLHHKPLPWEAVEPDSTWHIRVNLVLEQVTKSGTQRGLSYPFLSEVSCRLTQEEVALMVSRQQPRVAISDGSELDSPFTATTGRSPKLPGAQWHSDYCEPGRKSCDMP